MKATQNPVIPCVRVGSVFYSLFCIAWGQRCF
jgi:hypothetical protein